MIALQCEQSPVMLLRSTIKGERLMSPIFFYWGASASSEKWHSKIKGVMQIIAWPDWLFLVYWLLLSATTKM